MRLELKSARESSYSAFPQSNYTGNMGNHASHSSDLNKLGRSPRLSTRSALKHLFLVWRFDRLMDEKAICRFGAPERESLPRTFNLCVWNLHKGSGAAHFESDFRRLARENTMILAQEALLSPNLRQTFEMTGFQSIHAASYRRSDGMLDGVMSASKAPPTAPPERVVSARSEPIFRTPKVAVVTEYEVLGSAKPLTVVNAHSTLFRSVAQARREMHWLMSGIARNGGPLIVAGDFNTFSRGHFLMMSRELSRWGLRHARIPEDPRPRRKNLDHIYTRGVVISGQELRQDVTSSDHYPIVCRVSIES